MARRLILFFCFLLYIKSSAQLIYVLDKVTQQALPNVIVYSNNQKNISSTNLKGELSLENFKEADSLYFKLTGYFTKVVAVKNLEKYRYKIFLEEDELTLNEVIVSTSKSSENKIETPYRIEKINMKEIAFQNVQTSADLLGASGYAFIQKSQMGGGSPMIRGMATNRLLLVVDGVRMNTAIFRAGNIQNVISLDANAMEGAEILFGPGSVMYGTDAVGGVIDFHTLEPKFTDSVNKKLLVIGNAFMRTSTANSEKTGHINLKIGLNKLAFVSSFTRAEYGDLRSGKKGGVNSFYRPNYVQTISNKDYMVTNLDSSLQIGSKYNQTNFMQKIAFKPAKNLCFDYAYHYSETSPFNRYDRLTIMQTSGPYKNKLRWAEWYYGPQIWRMNRFGITHSKNNIAYNNVSFVAALQNFEESRYDREFGVREIRMQKEIVKAISFNLDFDKKITEKLLVYYGAEFVQNKVNSYATLTNVFSQSFDSTLTRYPNNSYWKTYGIYLTTKYKLTEKLILNTGIRYSEYKINATFDTTYFSFPFTEAKMQSGTFSGGLGAVYTPFISWQLYANASTGFRAPNIDDMGKVFESTPGYIVVPNPDLKPERILNAEVGTVKSFFGILKFDAAAYYSILKDAMVRKDFLYKGQSKIRFMGNPSTVQALQNVAEIRIYGIQAGLEFNYKGIGIKNTFSYQTGKEQSEDSLIFYPLRHAAPIFGSTHLTYQLKKLKLDFYVIYNGKMTYEQLALTERINPAYAKDEKELPYLAAWHTLNFKTAFYFNPNFSLMAGVENIEDILYRPYSSGINAPGRNFIISLNSKF